MIVPHPSLKYRLSVLKMHLDVVNGNYPQAREIGMEQQGDRVRRDVQQVTVNFFNHRFACPADNESETSLELKKRAFDYLLELALEKILAARGKHQQLKHEQRLLNKKLEAMKAGDWGQESMFSTWR